MLHYICKQERDKGISEWGRKKGGEKEKRRGSRRGEGERREGNRRTKRNTKKKENYSKQLRDTENCRQLPSVLALSKDVR